MKTPISKTSKRASALLANPKRNAFVAVLTGMVVTAGVVVASHGGLTSSASGVQQVYNDSGSSTTWRKYYAYTGTYSGNYYVSSGAIKNFTCDNDAWLKQFYVHAGKNVKVWGSFTSSPIIYYTTGWHSLPSKATYPSCLYSTTYIDIKEYNE